MSSSLVRHNSDRDRTEAHHNNNNNLSKCPSDQSDGGRVSSAFHLGTVQLVTCHITTADNHVYQVQVDSKSEANKVLSKICKVLGIMDEADYFGLQYFGKQSELLWLNLRNSLTKQMQGSSPYSLFLKVKYFVQPQRLIQEETKRQFFLNIVEHFHKGEWLTLDTNLKMISEMIALMTHTNYGAFNQTTTPCKYGCFWPESRGEIPNEALRIAANFHQQLREQQNSSTQYEVMRRAHSSLNLYGTHFFDATHMYGKAMKIGIGPEKLFICQPDGELIEEMVYTRLHMVYLSSKVVTLRVLDDHGKARERQYELKTRSLAQSMYRCITEIHAFFKSDNISPQVLEQTTNKNVLDSITALFESNHGVKEFAFDVIKTAQEVYDQALRNAYRLSQASGSQNRQNFFSARTSSPKFTLLGDSPPNIPEMLSNQSHGHHSSSVKLESHSSSLAICERRHSGEASMCSSSSDLSYQVEEVIQEELKSRTLCQYCCSEEITRVFTPCGHAVCCVNCSNRLEECPVCRAKIENRQVFFPPWCNVRCHSPASLADTVLHRVHHFDSDSGSGLTGNRPHAHHHHQAHKHSKEVKLFASQSIKETFSEGITIKRPTPGHFRQNSLEISHSSTPQTPDPRRIRTYSDFRDMQSHNNSATNSPNAGHSLIPRSLDLADDVASLHVRNSHTNSSNSPTNGNRPGKLCVTISSHLLADLDPPCSAEFAPFEPPSRVASGVPTQLFEPAFQMDETATNTPVGAAAGNPVEVGPKTDTK